MPAGFIALKGARGTPLVLLPRVFIQSLGLKRLGSVPASRVSSTISTPIGQVLVDASSM